MKSPSLEWLHAKLERHIRLTESYSEIKGLDFIIKVCRLKPHSYMFQERNNKLVLHRWWVDEFGNSLKITKNKRIKITYNDLNLDRKKLVCTDLYYGLSLDRIAKMSKLVHIIAGVDDDLYEKCLLISFLGIDNHLRSYLYLHGDWQQVSPLLLGMKQLTFIYNNLGKTAKNFKLKELPIPCITGEGWLSCLPVDDDFLQMLDRQHAVVLPFFKTLKE